MPLAFSYECTLLFVCVCVCVCVCVWAGSEFSKYLSSSSFLLNGSVFNLNLSYMQSDDPSYSYLFTLCLEISAKNPVSFASSTFHSTLEH